MLAAPEWASEPRTPEAIGAAMRRGFLEIDEELKQVRAGVAAGRLAACGGVRWAARDRSLAAARPCALAVAPLPSAAQPPTPLAPVLLAQHPDVLHGDDRSGSTAIAVMVTATHVICANCGDSRSVLVRGGGAGAAAGGDGVVEEMSYDHKPNNPGEMRRIQAAGGTVTMRRVNGDLAVSRALGDFVYKHRDDLPAEQQQVSAEPDVKIVPRRADDVVSAGGEARARAEAAGAFSYSAGRARPPSSSSSLSRARRPCSSPQALVLACDGIWDVMSNAEVAEFVLARAIGSAAEIKATTEALLDECLHRGSRDNMSVVLCAFPGGKTRGGEAAAAASAPPAAAAGADLA